jgi:hypothetical protein
VVLTKAMSTPFAAFVVPAALPRARRISITPPRFSATLPRVVAPIRPRRSRSSSLHLDWIRNAHRVVPADDDPDSRAAIVRAAKTQDATFRASAREAANAWAAELELLRTNRTAPSPAPATAAAAQKPVQVPAYAGVVSAKPETAHFSSGQLSFFERMARLNAIVSGSVAPSKTSTVPTGETASRSFHVADTAVASEKREVQNVAAPVRSNVSVPAPELPNLPVTMASISEKTAVAPGTVQNEMTPRSNTRAVPDRSVDSGGPAKSHSDVELAESLNTRSRQLVPSVTASSASSSPRIISRDLGPVALATSTGSFSQASAMKDVHGDQSVSSEAKNIVVISILALFICVCLALGEGYQSMASNLPFVI